MAALTLNYRCQVGLKNHVRPHIAGELLKKNQFNTNLTPIKTKILVLKEINLTEFIIILKYFNFVTKS